MNMLCNYIQRLRWNWKMKGDLSFSNFGILDLPVPYIFHRAQIRGIHHTGVARFHYDTVRSFLGGFLVGENRVIVLLLPLGRCPLFICLGICKRRQVRESDPCKCDRAISISNKESLIIKIAEVRKKKKNKKWTRARKKVELESHAKYGALLYRPV